MKRLAIAITVLWFLGGLTSCGDPGETEPSSGGFASCTDVLYVKGQIFDSWFLRHKLKRGLVGSPATAIQKDCADTGGTPLPDREVPVRRVAGIPLSQAFYRPSVGHWNIIYVAGDPTTPWQQLPPKVRSLVKHP